LAVPVALPSEPLTARDAAVIEEIADLAARDPKFRFGRFLKGAVGTVSRVAKVAAPIVGNFIREDVEPEFSARDFEGLDLSERELATLQELAVRDPNFFSKFKHIAGKVAHYAMPAARLAANVLIREDVEPEFTARDFEGLDLSERELATLQELAVRDPSFWNKIKHIAGKVAHYAMPAAKVAAGILIREDGMESVLELSERDLAEIEDLAARNPKFRLGGFLKKVTSTVGRVANVAGPIVSNFIREEDALSLRDLEEFVEIAERDPKFNLGRAFRKIKNTVSSVARVAAPIVSNFIREEDAEELAAREDVTEILELSERDLEELDELAARDPNFFRKLKGIAGHVMKVARPLAGIASNFIREDAEIDEVLAREYDLAMLD